MIELTAGLDVTPTVRLVRPLAEGGMGKVWIAEHTALATEVVVKFLSKDFSDNADAVARFKREAAVAASVKSPHVVQVLDYGVLTGGPPFIVMEHLEGRDLGEHLEAFGPMGLPDVAALVAQVAKGLGKAHQVGVVHRDIKPSNIFLCDGDGGEIFVKLLDFGVAKRTQLADNKTTTGMVIGTPHYMSPEQILADREVDARSDLWSLGVVAFQALTGKLPFDGATVGAITLAIHHSTPRVTAHRADLSPAVDEWFAKICAREPDARYASAREAAQALTAAVGDAPSGHQLVRPPMLTLPDPSEPSLGAAAISSPRPVTSLSTSFPVSSAAKRKPPVAWIAGAAVAVLGLAILTVVAVQKPSKETPTSAAANVAPPSPAAVPSAQASASEPASPAPEPSATADVPASTSTAAAAKPVVGAKPMSRPGTPAMRPTTKKRNDDDIK